MGQNQPPVGREARGAPGAGRRPSHHDLLMHKVAQTVLANLYLDALDRELESRGLSFCRYADDLTIYVSSERSAEKILASISAWIEKHLKLKVNAEKNGTGVPGSGLIWDIWCTKMVVWRPRARA